MFVSFHLYFTEGNGLRFSVRFFLTRPPPRLYGIVSAYLSIHFLNISVHIKELAKDFYFLISNHWKHVNQNQVFGADQIMRVLQKNMTNKRR